MGKLSKETKDAPLMTLTEVLRRLGSEEGLAVEDFEKTRRQWIVPGLTLEAFVTMAVDGLTVLLDGDKLRANREFEEAIGTFDLAKVEALRQSEIARRALRLPEIHDSHQ